MQDDFRPADGCRHAWSVCSSLVLVACALEPFEAAQGTDAGASSPSTVLAPSPSPAAPDDTPVSTPEPGDHDVQAPTAPEPVEPGQSSPDAGPSDELAACTDCDAGSSVGSVGSEGSDDDEPDFSDGADTTDNLDSGLETPAARVDAAPVSRPTDDGGDQGAPAAPVSSCGDDELIGPNGHCYFRSEESTTWSEAREACLARGDGWDMVAVEDAAEHEWISALLAEDTWMGASDAEQSDTWKWVATDQVFWLGAVDGEAVDGAFTRWWENAPSDTGDREQCGRFREREGEYYWADIQCDSEFPYVCETLGPTP